MKKLKTILFSVLVLGINVCTAQEPQTKPDKVKSFSKELSIDEAKAREVARIIEDSDKKMLELFRNPKSDSKVMAKSIANLISEKQLKLKALLTDEQFNLLKQMFKGQTDKSKRILEARVQKNNEELNRPLKGAQLKKNGNYQ